MKAVSDIRIDVIKDFCGISDDDSDGIVAVVMPAAVAFIESYTGLTLEQIDAKPEMAYAYLTIVNDMYTTRNFQEYQAKSLNKCAKTILDANSMNLVGWCDAGI